MNDILSLKRIERVLDLECGLVSSGPPLRPDSGLKKQNCM